MTSFSNRLAAAVCRCGNPVVVGLDPRADQLPPGFLSGNRNERCEIAHAYRLFCRAVIDVVAPLVPAVKPQAAFFEQLGVPGVAALRSTIEYAHQRGLLVIVDGKRNDIGSTAEAYADAYLGAGHAEAPFGGDALTVSPYLGDDSLQPFVDTALARNAGVFVLVKTSNPGGKAFQDLICEGRPLYRHVGDLVERLAAQTASPYIVKYFSSAAEVVSESPGGLIMQIKFSIADELNDTVSYGAIGAVVGATYPEQLAELRQAMPHAWILVPGFGSQGGTARDVAGAFDDYGLGAIVNNSRGIIFAHSRKEYSRFGPDRWQAAVEAATRDMIDQLRADTYAGRLSSKYVHAKE